MFPKKIKHSGYWKQSNTLSNEQYRKKRYRKKRPSGALGLNIYNTQPYPIPRRKKSKSKGKKRSGAGGLLGLDGEGWSYPSDTEAGYAQAKFGEAIFPWTKAKDPDGTRRSQGKLRSGNVRR